MPSLIKDELKAYVSIADGIYEFFGKAFEVVIHDFEDPEHSIVYIAGNVTKRKIGGPVTSVILEVVRNDDKHRKERLFYSMRTEDGNEVKSMTTFIRNMDDVIIGCMCIIGDYTPAKMMIKWLEGMIQVDDHASEEFYGNDVNEILDRMICVELENSLVPLHLMGKDDKVSVVKKLDQKGLFLIKGAVEKVGQALNVSRYTIYNYIDEIRAE